MPHVLFVCTGNICRSPYAERYAALLSERANAADWSFASAGTAALAGHDMNEHMADELAVLGGNSTDFAARQLTHDVLAEADWIVALAESHRRWVLREYSDRLRSTITLGRLGATLDELDPSLRGEDLLAAAAGIRRAADPDQDVDDPYGRGRAAAAASAATITAHLDAVTERLF